jgi:TonB family protein
MVLLTLKVSKTGAVVDVGFIEQGDEGLRRAAIDGVQQWRYKPLLVNGEPQEFQSTVTVEFLNGVGKRASAGGMSGMAGRVMGGIGTPPPVEARAPGVPNGPVRVSSGVIASLMLERVDPVYPPIARAAGVQGVVILHAILSKNGTIESLQVISGSPMLMGAAMDAVKLWRYKPYLLNGVPVEVDTVINVNFMLETAPPPGDGGAPENPK